MSNLKKIRLGIIGLGNMGSNHLKILSFLNSAEIVFTSDLNIKNKKKNFFFTKNPYSLLKEVDAVIIATSTSSHLELIEKIGKEVKNILIEKPIAQNFFETKKIINFAKKNKLNMKVGFIERFNPAIESLTKNIKKNEKIINIDFTRTNPVSTRIKDVDIVTDLMVHDIDLAILLNGKVKYTKSFGFKRSGRLVHASSVLIHNNGSISRILTSIATQKKIRQISITLKNKYVECDLLRKEVHINKNTKVKEVNQSASNYKSFQEVIETGHQEALLSELKAFIESCHGIRSRYLSDYLDSYEVMRVCQLIKSKLKINDKR